MHRECTGLAYRLVHLHPPHLYVLRKEQLVPGKPPATLNSYYILDGTIFEAPTVQRLVESRMVGYARIIYGTLVLQY